MKSRLPESCLDEWREEMTLHIGNQVACDAASLLVSAESLSLLRYEDEVQTLAHLLAPRELRVAVCLRDPATFLESYRRELQHIGQSPSNYPSSHAYLE